MCRKIANTPLRDILRGRLTGREDWRGVIENAQLPDSLRKLTTNVVRRTRLRRLEKASVAQELCASFRDGLETGATAEELADSFGDAQSAAKRIRRERKRQRHVLWRFMSRTAKIVGVVLLLLAAVYVFELVRFNMRTPTISRDYVAEINAQIEAIPEEDRAWPIYRQAILSLYPLTAQESKAFGAYYSERTKWDELVALAHKKSEALKLFRQAAKERQMGRPWTTSLDPEILIAMGLEQQSQHRNARPMLLDIFSEHLGSIRKGALLLAADAKYAAAQADSERIENNLIAIIGMSSHRKVQQTLINTTFDESIFNIALNTIQIILLEHPDVLSDDQLARIAQLLDHIPLDIPAALQTERLTFYDVIQRVYSDDGAGDGFATRNYILLEDAGFMGPALALFLPSRLELVNKYDDIIDEIENAAELPLWKQIDFNANDLLIDLDRNMLTEFRYSYILILEPALNHPALNIGRAFLYRDAARTAIALELYKRRKNTYPETLEQLTPDLLPTVPLDHFDGKPLRYKLQDGAPLLYSVGVNQIDESGQPVLDADGDPMPDAAADPSKRDQPGDWILHPPSN